MIDDMVGLRDRLPEFLRLRLPDRSDTIGKGPEICGCVSMSWGAEPIGSVKRRGYAADAVGPAVGHISLADVARDRDVPLVVIERFWNPYIDGADASECMRSR